MRFPTEKAIKPRGGIGSTSKRQRHNDPLVAAGEKRTISSRPCHYAAVLFTCSLYLLVGFELRGLILYTPGLREPALERQSILPISYFLPKKRAAPGCFQWEGVMPPRQVQKELFSKEEEPPSGLVVSLLLGDHLLPYICHFFPSQMAHFIGPQGLDVLFVIPKPLQDQFSYSTGNSTSSNATTTPITMRALQKCLNLSPVSSQDDDGNNYVYQDWQNLDGSTLTTWEHKVAGYKNRFFLAETELQLPSYVQSNRSFLDIPIEPKSCRAPLTYIQGTRWYIYEMLHLQILQGYDFIVKVDADIVFVKSIPFHMLHDMTVRGAVFGHFAKYPDGVNTPCADHVAQAVQQFSRQRKETLASSSLNTTSWDWDGNFCSHEHALLQVDSDRYYGNFLILKTDYFQSPGPLQLGKFLSDEWQDGFFRHRWGDQAYWHFALGLFLGPNFEDAVVDYTEFRCAPEPNCWLSSQEGRRIPDAANLCNNPRGTFLHTKSWRRFANQWNRWGARSEPLHRGTRPYQTTYVHECFNSTRWKSQ